MTEDEEDLELADLLDRHEAGCGPITDTEHEVWFAKTKAKISTSVADPRSPVPLKDAFNRLRVELDRMHLKDDEAA